MSKLMWTMTSAVCILDHPFCEDIALWGAIQDAMNVEVNAIRRPYPSQNSFEGVNSTAMVITQILKKIQTYLRTIVCHLLPSPLCSDNMSVSLLVWLYARLMMLCFSDALD